MSWATLIPIVLEFAKNNWKYIAVGGLVWFATASGCRMTANARNQWAINRLERAHQRAWRAHQRTCGCEGEADGGRRRILPWLRTHEREAVPTPYEWLYGKPAQPTISPFCMCFTCTCDPCECTEADPCKCCEVIESPQEE